MTRLRLGACLSLTGRFGRFGRQAATGSRSGSSSPASTWSFEIEDDGSDPAAFAAAYVASLRSVTCSSGRTRRS